MNSTAAISPKRQWRMPVLVAMAAVLFAVAFAASATLSRMGSAPRTAVAPRSDVAAGGVSAIDRQIGALQDQLRQQPSDSRSATQLGLAYLQRARETSDPSYLSRADGILKQALEQAPNDTDTLIGLGTLALARHQFQAAVDWGQRAVASNEFKSAAYGVLGDAYTELGMYEDAVSTIQKMVDLGAMRGVVVAPQPLAAEVGAELLARGGNAFDAAIGTAFVQMVTDPQMCGLGGFGCATYASPGVCQHLAFHARAGSRATSDMWAADFRGRTELGGYTLFDDHRSNLGHTSVGTPGVVAGLASLHSRARLPWAELLEPAASLARSGFPAPEYAFEHLRRPALPGMPGGEQRVSFTPDSQRLWCRPDGSLKHAGDHWSNPDLAETLERLARSGARDFYAGELAQTIAAEIARGGGFSTAEDLRAYEVRLSDPIEGTFRGLRVRSAAPPASGISCVQMLQILDHFPELVPGAPESYVLLAAAMREAFLARSRAVADPEFLNVPVSELVSTAWADEAAERIRAGSKTPVAASVSGEGTTHVSTYDADGNAVALTHTLGIYSGVIVPGTGIALNSGMDLFDPLPGGPNSIQPGKARVSGMAPTIVFDGRHPRIVSGAPGTNAIVTSVVQVIVGVVDGELSPVEAVSAPRVHCEGGPVFVEGRVSRAGREALGAAGFELLPQPTNYAPSFGRNQLIVIDSRGHFRGASDPRRDGGIAAYSEG